MTVFDAIRDGQEYTIEFCKTGKPHSFIEYEDWVECGKHYQVLVCENCGKRSVGYTYVC
jgi:hypothetical protein